MGDCIFCQIVQGTIPTTKCYEDDTVIAFEDINPQAPVHMLVIPKKHINSLAEVQEEEAELMGRLILAATKLARERKLDGSGYRVIVNTGREAGQTVFHLHVHVLGGRSFQWPPG